LPPPLAGPPPGAALAIDEAPAYPGLHWKSLPAWGRAAAGTSPFPRGCRGISSLLRLPVAPRLPRQKPRACTWTGATCDRRLPARRGTGAAPDRRDGRRRGAGPGGARGRLRRVPAAAGGTQPGRADAPGPASQPRKRPRDRPPTRRHTRTNHLLPSLLGPT